MNKQNEIFYDTDFSGDDLSYSQFIKCKFIRCDFSRADLRDATFEACSFIESNDLAGCYFDYADLRDCSFKDCQLAMSSFKGIQGFGAEFRNCDLKGTIFSNAKFANYVNHKVFFCSLYMTGCNLSYASFEQLHLEKCELFENRWIDANLTGTSFQGSDLSRGVFSPSVWRQINIQNCDLSHCDLEGVDIRRTDLTGVKICQWQVEQLLSPIGLVLVPD